MEPIQVFEYERLSVNQRFTEDHLDALALYNQENGNKFFKLDFKGIHFQQYVGVIQVGDLTIEILPKIGKESSPGTEKDKWQAVLIDMLQECNWMSAYEMDKAHLQHKHNSVLEAYFELFVRECEILLNQGLIKKYRQTEANIPALKGRLIFSKNIQHNIVHQERFYTRHQVYDRNNIFNQILVKALEFIPKISSSPLLNDRVYKLLFSFPEIDELNVTAKTFSNLTFDRKTYAYKEAISIAAMIILNYRPDIISGRNHVLALLFDMNELWEEYVYRQLVKSNQNGWCIKPKPFKIVWEKNGTQKKITKKIIPDILLSSNGKHLIIDTKWKLPEDDIPSDGDLKQMFMYNEYWDQSNSILLYPKECGDIELEQGRFISGERFPGPPQGFRHLCAVMRASVLRSNLEDNSTATLDQGFGSNIISKIVDNQLL